MYFFYQVETGKIVAVMEYCDKSLFLALSEPENRFGLPEDEFIRFFRHIGMVNGVVKSKG